MFCTFNFYHPACWRFGRRRLSEFPKSVLFVLVPNFAMSNFLTLTFLTGYLMTKWKSSSFTVVEPGSNSSYSPCRSLSDLLCADIFLANISSTNLSVIGVVISSLTRRNLLCRSLILRSLAFFIALVLFISSSVLPFSGLSYLSAAISWVQSRCLDLNVYLEHFNRAIWTCLVWYYVAEQRIVAPSEKNFK